MLYSLHVSDFKFAGKLSQILQNYQCSIVEHSEVKETWDAQGQKVKAILSAAFEQKLGGLKAVVEMVKKRGAKSIVIVDEAAEAFRVERSMNGALLRVSMPSSQMIWHNPLSSRLLRVSSPMGIARLPQIRFRLICLNWVIALPGHR
jgi:hypothetical protein